MLIRVLTPLNLYITKDSKTILVLQRLPCRSGFVLLSEDHSLYDLILWLQVVELFRATK